MTGPLIPSHSDSPSSRRLTPSPAISSALTTPAEDLSSEEGTGQFTRIVAAIRRFAWLIGLVTVVGTAGGILLSSLLQPTYGVEATIYLQNTEQSGSGPIQAPELLSSYNWAELVKTFAVLDP